MRTVELAKVAASAEALRLRRVARRQAMRVAFGAAAGVFAVAVLVVLHVLAYHVILKWLTPVQSVLVLLALDVLITAAFAFLAMRNTPDAVEVEAETIRRQAIAEMRKSLTMMGMVAEVTGLVVATGAPGGIRRGIAAAVTDIAARLKGR